MPERHNACKANGQPVSNLKRICRAKNSPGIQFIQVPNLNLPTE